MNMGLVPQEMSTTPNRDLVRPPVPTTPNMDQQSGLQDIFNKALSSQRGETPTTVGTTTATQSVTPPAVESAPTTDPTQADNMQPINVPNQDPFASGVTQIASGLDPLTEQLLFGIGGQGGFIPGAMRAAEKVFYDEQGNPIVID